MTAEDSLADLPIVPRIVRRTFVDAHRVLRPVAFAERVAGTRRGRVLGRAVTASLFVVALLLYAWANLQVDPGWASAARARARALATGLR